MEGVANAAICEYIAEVLGVKRRAVALVAGAKSRDKVVEVAGLAAGDALARLQAHLATES